MNKFVKSVLSVCLCLAMLLTVSSVAFALTLTGEGTKESPYLITDLASLKAFASEVNSGNSFEGKYVRLENDIKVDSSFTPIGTKTAPFSGYFDGNSKKLSSLSLKCDYAGVFGYTEGAEITSLTVAGTCRATDYAGAVVAYAKDTVIRNCTGAANVYADSFNGGIVGYIESGAVEGCKVNTRISIGGYVENCGGIAGYSGADITECVNNAFVYGEKNVGGIAGSSTGNIALCTNASRIEASDSNVGGIAGITEGKIRYSKNNGMVISSGTGVGKAGGIAGVAYKAEIAECISAGVLTVSGNYAGGIAGYITNTVINNCVAAANVTTSQDYAGGIFGYSLSSQVSKCIFTAAASATAAKGGIGALSAGTVTGCYFNGDKNDKALAAGSSSTVTAIKEADILDKSVYTALDFDSLWTVNTVHASYPLPKNSNYHNLTVTSTSYATCTENGIVASTCSVCQETVLDVTPAFGHSYIVISSAEVSCTVDGYKDELCTVCGDTVSYDYPAPGHKDNNSDNKCDACGINMLQNQIEEKGFFQKIVDFFNSIIEWFRNLFK